VNDDGAAAEGAGQIPVHVVGRPLRVGAAIIGAQKAGTTSLAATLATHPGICLASGKEAHLFDRPDVQARGPQSEDLERFFAHRRPGQVLLDATPSYLYLPGCIEALVRHEPAVRLIVVLRDPAARAVSHHAHEVRHNFERRRLVSALPLERRRLRRDRDPLAPDSAHRHSSYLDRGRYDKQLDRLRDVAAHVLVVRFEELVASPQRVLDAVTAFLGVDPLPIGHLPHLNGGDARQRRVVHRVLRVVTRPVRLRTERVLRETGWAAA
jgi:hypothetical protein